LPVRFVVFVYGKEMMGVESRTIEQPAGQQPTCSSISI